MGKTRWLGVLLLSACAVGRTEGQEIPKATPEGKKVFKPEFGAKFRRKSFHAKALTPLFAVHV